MERIVACIVSYNPDFDRLRENIKACSRQVEEIVVIDNGSKNVKGLEKTIQEFNNVKIISLNNNNGIAYALNEGLLFAKKNQYDWTLTLDQDSVVKDGLIDSYKQMFSLKHVGMMTCIIRDRNFGIDSIIPLENSYYIEIDKCITSGALVNVRTAVDINGFDDSMFIDYVDFDICKRMIIYGASIIRVNVEGLLHEVGRAKEYTRHGKRTIVYNHNSVRHYYQARNRVYYLRKYRSYLSLQEKKSLIVLHFKKIMEIIKYEQNKISKLWSYLKGIIAGIFSPIIWGAYTTHEEKVDEA